MHFVWSQQANRIDLELLFMKISSPEVVTIRSPNRLSHTVLLICTHNASWQTSVVIYPTGQYHYTFQVTFVILLLCSLLADHRRVWTCGQSMLIQEKSKRKGWGNWGKQNLRRVKVKTLGKVKAEQEHGVFNTYLMLKNSSIINRRQKAKQTFSVWFS